MGNNISVDKPQCYISKLIFNNSECLEIKPNDIVVFVGPNNTGKSQSLKDIHELTKGPAKTVVVNQVECSFDFENIKNYVINNSFEIPASGGQSNYQGFGYNIHFLSLLGYTKDNVLGQMRDYFIAYLNTSNRLSICNPPTSIPRDGIPQHPIHIAAYNKSSKKWLSDSFRKAFGEGLIPNSSYGATLPLCVGNSPNIEKHYSDMGEMVDDYAEILKGYKQVQNQGDGIKSFTGILLYLMIERYSSFLIDEPESFLHPPQARIMGEIIGESLKNNQQAFISTHSEEIIKGLLAKCNKRLKVVRITREGDKNSFRILHNDELQSLWDDSILSHSNIITSLFHNKVVLCESDSDCKMYSLIEEHLCSNKSIYSETLYIHCGGKQRIAVVAKALKAVGIDVRIIVDMDVLNDEAILSSIVESMQGDWVSLKSHYRILSSQLHSPKPCINRKNAQIEIDEVINGDSSINLSEEEIKKISDIIKVSRKWEPLKEFGFAGAPSGDGANALSELDKQFKKFGLFIVPVGELEKFVREIGGHGPKWVNKVIEAYPDFSNGVYNGIRSFIAEVVNI